jgi:hypothetical protein
VTLVLIVRRGTYAIANFGKSTNSCLNYRAFRAKLGNIQGESYNDS